MLVRWTSTVLWVTKSAWAISRLVSPSAASSATRRSLGASESTPLRARRRDGHRWRAAPAPRVQRFLWRRRSWPARQHGEAARAPGAAVGSAKCRPELSARLRVLQLRGRAIEHLHRFLEQRESVLAALDEASGAESPRRAPAARPMCGQVPAPRLRADGPRPARRAGGGRGRPACAKRWRARGTASAADAPARASW